MSSRTSRSLRVRAKVAALLVSLAALWGFAAFVTLREGINLLFVSALDEGIAQPLETLRPAIQQERKLTLVYLGNGSQENRRAMLDQRERTDAAAVVYRQGAASSTARFAASDELINDLADTDSQLDSLQGVRDRIDSQSIASRATAADSFTTVLDTIFKMYDSLGALDDKDLAADVRTLVALTRAQEILAQEDALVAGALSAGTMTNAERDTITQIVGTQRFLREDAAFHLAGADVDAYRTFATGAAMTQLGTLEARLMQAPPQSGAPPPVSLTEWSTSIDKVYAEFDVFILAAGDSLIARSTPVAVWVIVRLALAGGLGLIAVIASIIISITTARALIRQLERLRNAARELSDHRLPRVVDRLQHGEKVDIEHEAPPLDFGRDEIGQVGEAFNAVQETAVRVAVEQAELRRSVRDVFLSLARRSQALLHRQLGLLDAMERRATDAEELAELFRIDHLATRMRRNAENLIVLSGATAGRAWRKPVPMVDVLRGALAEVEDYTRVTVVPVGSASLLGRAVGDVIHLLAELIENAVSFSPPQTAVRVGGSIVGNGFAIEIEDRGLGMSPEEREAANEQLSNPPEFKLTSTARLGLYVVGKLAERHGIRVRLTESPYGGTTAIVLLPSTLIADESADDVLRLDAGDFEVQRSRVPRATVGRHRDDALIATSQPRTAVQSVPEAALPLSNHVMRADLATAASSNQVNAGPVMPALAPPPPPSPAPSPETASPPPPPLPPPPPVASAPATLLTPSALAEDRMLSPQSPHLVPGGLQSVGPVITPVVGSVITPVVGSVITPVVGSVITPVTPQPVPTTGDGQSRPDEPTVLTPSGLPWRQRTSPAPAEQVTPPTGEWPVTTATDPAPEWPGDARSAPPAPESTAPPAARGLEETRSLMASYRSGTLRGRTEAARLAESSSHPPDWTPPTQESVGTEDGG